VRLGSLGGWCGRYCSGDAFDQAVDAEAAKVVAHLVGAVVAAEESGDKPAMASVREAGDGVEMPRPPSQS